MSILSDTYGTKINTIPTEKSHYLQIIKDIAYAPERLYYIGNIPGQRLPTVAIVGSRKPTTYGKEVTHRLSYELAQQGVIILSGLAFGVDGIAHKAALEAKGTTIAVLAGGLDAISPRNHHQLAQQIVLSGGALLSEYPPGTPSYPNQFLARNRLISGLADLIIVTEATERSGSLSTARHGLDQNKEIGAIPGPITSLLSKGTNRLLQQGAHVITATNDVLPLITTTYRTLPIASRQPQDPSQIIIVQLLKQGIQHHASLFEQSQLPIEVFLQTLSLLEIDGVIKRLDESWSLC